MGVHDIRLFGDQIAASRIEQRFGAVSAQGLLRLAVRDLYPGRIALVSSLGADSAVLLHMVSLIDPALPVVFIDTGKLFPETLAYRDLLARRLGLTKIETVSADPAEAARLDPGGALNASDPDACCDLRKVRPLAQALAGYDAWITGRKRFQSATRAALALFEADGARVKINPLAAWDAAAVLAYLQLHDLPRHPLVARNYPSIGCEPCTTPVAPGEDARSGRWRGRGKTECGIHIGTINAGAGI